MSKDGAGSKDRGVGNNWGVGNGGSGSIGGNSLVGHFGDVAAVGVSHVVVDVLDPAVGQGHPVGAAGGVAVTLLVLPEVGTAVVVGHAVLVGVDGGLVVVAAAVTVTGNTAGGGKGLSESGADNHGEDDESLDIKVTC